jgi:fatty-acyl-CoA synthase
LHGNVTVEPGLSHWSSDLHGAAEISLSIGDGLQRAAEQFGDRDAVIYAHAPDIGDTRWSYRELNALSDRLAVAILASGLAPGERVAIWGPNHPHWILLEYALAKAGITIVALNPLYKRLELLHTLNTASVAAVFHATSVGGESLGDLLAQIAPQVPTLRATYSFSAGIDQLLRATSPNRTLPRVDPGAPFIIQYTSGTTGLPKAALLSHRGVGTNARNSYRCWGFDVGDRVCHGFPFFHVGGSGNSIPGAMYVGAATLPIYVFKAEKALNIIEQERCTGFIGVPTMLTAMLADPSFQDRDFSALRCIVIGGAPVAPRLLQECEKAFGVRTCNGYGQTETSGVCTSTIAEDSEDKKTNTSGRALPGVSLKIVDSTGTTVRRQTPGELLYKGPGNMIGYLDNAQNDASTPLGGWIATGDIATMDADGYISIVGRCKEMIIRGGENLYPLEIEKYLAEHSSIAEVAVVGLPDLTYGEEICAVLRLNRGTQLNEATLRTWCQSRVSRWKVPRYIAIVTAFPVTASGKVQKSILRDQMIAFFGLQTIV